MLPHATNPKTWFCSNCFYHKLFFLQFAAILDFQLYLSQCFGVPVRSVGFHRRSDDPVVFFCDRNDSLRLEQVWKIIVFGTYGTTSLQYPFGISLISWCCWFLCACMFIPSGCDWVWFLSGLGGCVFVPSGAQRGPLRDNQSVLIMRQILRGAAVGFFGKSGNRREWWIVLGLQCFDWLSLYRLFPEIQVGPDMVYIMSLCRSLFS